MPATEEVWRPLRTMHVVFAVSAFAMTAATIWMMVADYDDEWRDYQRTGFKLAAQQLEAKKEVLDTKSFEEKKGQIEGDIHAAETAQAKEQEKIAGIQKKVDQLEGEFALATRGVRFQRAARDKARADLDLKVRDGLLGKQLAPWKTEFDKQQAEVDKLEFSLQVKQAEFDGAKAELAALTKTLDDARADLKKHKTELDRLEAARQKIDPELGHSWSESLAHAKFKFMEWPIVEGFNSHLKVSQLWLPELTINYGGMRDVPRFDRCITCHMHIDRVETGNIASFPHDPHGLGANSHDAKASQNEKVAGYAHPYSTHPNPDLYLTASSPHPMQKFGCTSCHEGQGSGTSFQNASHSPNSPDIAEHWKDEYKFFHNHFWEYPMYPKRLAEAGCVKCHHNIVELGVNPKFGASAPKLYKGYELIRQYGCFGCHEINGYNAGKAIGPDMRLEPQTKEEADRIAADSTAVAGTMRKVGPGLRHFASKTTAGWAESWIREPKSFRPETRMPQFFGLTNQQDKEAAKFQPIEIAGIAAYLLEKSEDLPLDNWESGYQPNAERGKLLFSQRGCLACHAHDDFPGIKADFGPNLTNAHAKIKPGADGAKWVYTWIRNPQKHSERTKMPDLFLDPEGEGANRVDPAADIAAYLLQKGPAQYPVIDRNSADFSKAADELIRKFLTGKVLTNEQVDKVLAPGGVYPKRRVEVKGDEIELFGPGETAVPITPQMKLQYIGRRSISRYGCYGCHDIPDFEKARPIGTALQDWGRKDPTKLALEHIEEFLHHHGEPAINGKPNPLSTAERIEQITAEAADGKHQTAEDYERETAPAYFYEQLLTHGRAGFLWQKLRDPRSYDYKKIETKGYDERLRMPKFPFNETDIEAIATFVLGLVAEPPAEKYLYRPTGAAKSRIEGEKLLTKYNCVGCHMVELPEVRYSGKPEDVTATPLSPADYEEGHQLLLRLKAPHDGLSKEKTKTGESIISFRGLISSRPDPQDPIEDQEYGYDLWETLKVGENVVLPGSRMLVPAKNLIASIPARGGPFAEWLVEAQMKLNSETNRNLAWQMSPPPLYQEGIKVQTQWLYSFLKNPNRIRYTTVLRMPKFSLSDTEAMQLANYFSAVDGSEYPYQDVPERNPAYLAAQQAAHPGYQQEMWKLLNAPLCIKCHSVAGREYQGDPKKDIRGPNLDAVTDRLQSDWLTLWLFKPAWITPYTSMPAPLPKNQKQFEEFFKGEGLVQTMALRDALMNYHRLLEKEGKLSEVSAAPASEKKPGTGGGQ